MYNISVSIYMNGLIAYTDRPTCETLKFFILLASNNRTNDCIDAYYVGEKYSRSRHNWHAVTQSAPFQFLIPPIEGSRFPIQCDSWIKVRKFEWENVRFCGCIMWTYQSTKLMKRWGPQIYGHAELAPLCEHWYHNGMKATSDFKSFSCTRSVFHTSSVLTARYWFSHNSILSFVASTEIIR